MFIKDKLPRTFVVILSILRITLAICVIISAQYGSCSNKKSTKLNAGKSIHSCFSCCKPSKFIPQSRDSIGDNGDSYLTFEQKPYKYFRYGIDDHVIKDESIDCSRLNKAISNFDTTGNHKCSATQQEINNDYKSIYSIHNKLPSRHYSRSITDRIIIDESVENNGIDKTISVVCNTKETKKSNKITDPNEFVGINSYIKKENSCEYGVQQSNTSYAARNIECISSIHKQKQSDHQYLQRNTETNCMQRYIDKLNTVACMTIDDEQSMWLQNFYKTQCHKVNSDKTKERRPQFNRKKGSLINKWEMAHLYSWPSGYTCHHIIPISHNGPNDARNIMPLDQRNHTENA